MSSVSKRRRDRLRAKKERLHQERNLDNISADSSDSDEPRRRRKTPDGHVAPATGRQAKKRRKNLHKEAPEYDEEVASPATPLPSREKPKSTKRKSLRQRRRERQQERMRREGLDPQRPEERVRPLGVVWISWRWFSGALSIVLVVVMFVVMYTDVFIIDSIAVGGQSYIPREEIFKDSGLVNKHLFWVDPQEVEARLEESSAIADAQVYIGWPPNMISIVITEREPALVWQEGEIRVWVDVNGTIMFQRETRSDLLLIKNTDDSYRFDPSQPLKRDIIAGALQLKSMYPNIESLTYDRLKGLGYADGRNWIVWFGVGTNMEIKAKVYDTIVRVNSGVAFREIDVSDPDHPYFVERFPTE